LVRLFPRCFAQAAFGQESYSIGVGASVKEPIQFGWLRSGSRVSPMYSRIAVAEVSDISKKFRCVAKKNLRRMPPGSLRTRREYPGA
jgi:hypothetical protein